LSFDGTDTTIKKPSNKIEKPFLISILIHRYQTTYYLHTLTMSAQQYQFQCHRLDFSANCTEELEEFSRIHRYDDRKTFKEAWTIWIQQKDTQNMIDEEYSFAQNTQVLDEHLSKKTLLDKMFKSVRYYHRKKWIHDTTETVELDGSNQVSNEVIYSKKAAQKLKGFSKEFLAMIDKSIQEQIQHHTKKQNNHVITITQKELFDGFCETCKKEIFQECINQKQINGPETLDTIFPRLKKTVKNRYYNLRQQYIIAQ
jgi:hypothetical protein